MIEPSVCEPSARGTMPAATAAAEPLDDPPGAVARIPRVYGGAGMTPGKLRRDGLAKDDSAKLLYLAHDFSVFGGHVPGIDR